MGSNLPVTIDEACGYLGIDYADEMVRGNIERAIRTADAYLKGSIGKDYPKRDPRAKELALIIVSDLYDNRMLTETSGRSSTVSNATRKIVEDLSLQLRLELRR